VKILLVNSNPVVSRLFALCTRDKDNKLDETEDIEKADRQKKYDLVFIDDASYSESSREFIEKHYAISKKVFIAYTQEQIHGFDMTLKKPFLPSQILDIIKSVVAREVKEDPEELPVIFPLEDTVEPPVHETEVRDTPSIFPLTTEETEEEISSQSPSILDGKEIEKIKGLLEMEEEISPVEEILPDEIVEARKVEAIKAQLIADGLEIVDEEEIVKVLDTANKSKKKKKKVKTDSFSKKEFERIQKACMDEVFKLKPKKVRKLLKGKKIEITLKLKDHN